MNMDTSVSINVSVGEVPGMADPTCMVYVYSKDRLFSLSSVSSPAMKIPKPGEGGGGGGKAEGGGGISGGEAGSSTSHSGKRGRPESGADPPVAKRGPGRPPTKHLKHHK